MKTDSQSILLLIGGVGFALYLVLQLVAAPRRRRPGYAQARARVMAAKRRASDRGLAPAERAAALREGARAALEEGLRRPGLAAAFARRAERLDPGNPESAGLVSLALRRAARYSALERLLWGQIADAADPQAADARRVIDELVGLYEGPLQRPETARALRRLTASTEV